MKTADIKVGEEYAIARSTYAMPRQRARVVALGVERRVYGSANYSSRMEKNGIELVYLHIGSGQVMDEREARGQSYMRPNPARAQNIIRPWSEEQASLDAQKVATDERKRLVDIAFEDMYALTAEANRALGASGDRDEGPFFVRGRLGGIAFPEAAVDDLESLMATIIERKT